MFLSSDTPDWCSNIFAARFDIPPTLRSLGGTAHVAELIAIHAGLHLLHSLNLRRTVYSDCLSAVKKITDAGAALISSRSLLSSGIHLVWHKGYPERSDTPPSAWSRQQWGTFIADRLAKRQDICSLPFSPIPALRIHTIPLPDILRTTPPPGGLAVDWLSRLSPSGEPALDS